MNLIEKLTHSVSLVENSNNTIEQEVSQVKESTLYDAKAISIGVAYGLIFFISFLLIYLSCRKCFFHIFYILNIDRE